MRPTTDSRFTDMKRSYAEFTATIRLSRSSSAAMGRASKARVSCLRRASSSTPDIEV